MFFGSDRFHHIAHCLGMKNPVTFLQILITVMITMQYVMHMDTNYLSYNSKFIIIFFSFYRCPVANC